MKRLARFGLAVVLLGLSGCMLLFLSDSVLYEETFTAQNTAWILGSSETSEKWIADGLYHVAAKAAVISVGYNQVEGPFGDVQVDLDVDHVQGVPGNSAGGLALRVQDGKSFIAFVIAPSGTFSVQKLVSGTVTRILNYTGSPAIVQGVARNHLTVVCRGTTYRFLVNGTELAMITDSSFASGRVGAVVISYDASTPAVMTFDNLLVQEVE
ncbi:MAG: hypothetical protein AB1778_05475 [Candidatus Bipolaricaulota bacterium]